jgi:hypothetical protein
MSNNNLICVNGCPVPNNNLYSAYQIYQKTFTPQYLLVNPPLEYINSCGLGPANIFIKRHNEKTKGDEEWFLNCNGIYRAIETIDYINKLGQSGFPISAIVTPNPSTAYVSSDSSIRPQQSASLASFMLNIPTFIYGNSNVSQPFDTSIIIEIFKNPVFNGKNIFIFWEHKNIQALCDQIVRAYLYLNLSLPISEMNNQKLLNINTSQWWIKNSPIPPSSRYISTEIPTFPIPYYDYSLLLPYYNTNNFDTVYQFTLANNDLTLNITSQNISTCNDNCNLVIGYLQYDGLSSYKDESKCVPPS